MDKTVETSDAGILDLLRRRGALSIAELASATGVTATAVRQRLSRLMAAELVERKAERHGRGRPGHRYSLTAKGAAQAGNNFADLAVVLWEEIRAVKDVEVRRGLLERLVGRLAAGYRSQVHGGSVAERMESLAALMGEREIPFDAGGSEELPVLNALACPYPGLAEHDRGVCAMERMMLSEMVGSPLQLTQCRLDGANCCTFEAG